jgi:hypothetical protein
MRLIKHKHHREDRTATTGHLAEDENDRAHIMPQPFAFATVMAGQIPDFAVVSDLDCSLSRCVYCISYVARWHWSAEAKVVVGGIVLVFYI